MLMIFFHLFMFCPKCGAVLIAKKKNDKKFTMELVALSHETLEHPNGEEHCCPLCQLLASGDFLSYHFANLTGDFSYGSGKPRFLKIEMKATK